MPYNKTLHDTRQGLSNGLLERNSRDSHSSFAAEYAVRRYPSRERTRSHYGKKPKRVSVFIDDVHLFQTAYTLGIEINHQKLLSELVGKANLQKAFLYSIHYKSNLKQTQFFRAMKDQGVDVVVKEVTSTALKPSALDLGAHIVTDMLTQAAFSDMLVVVSSNEQIADAREHIARQGTAIKLVSLRERTSQRLLTAADRHVDIAELQQAIQN